MYPELVKETETVFPEGMRDYSTSVPTTQVLAVEQRSTETGNVTYVHHCYTGKALTRLCQNVLTGFT